MFFNKKSGTYLTQKCTGISNYEILIKTFFKDGTAFIVIHVNVTVNNVANMRQLFPLLITLEITYSVFIFKLAKRNYCTVT